VTVRLPLLSRNEESADEMPAERVQT
jgi:hypothetical protein